MQIPRYYYFGSDPALEQYLRKQPHQKRHFEKNEYLWKPGEYIERVYYIQSGLAVASVAHENGRQKIFLFAGRGSVYPGCHETQFKIEQSITARTISPVDALEFERSEFYRMFQENPQLNAFMFESYAMYVNLLLYETAHQEYNRSFVKLCNLLYLSIQNVSEGSRNRLDMSQETIADILAINRVNVAKHLAQLRDEGIIRPHRKWIEILDMETLQEHCSAETLA